MINFSIRNIHELLDPTSDDDSLPEDIISPEREYNYPRDHISNIVEFNIKPPIRESSKGIFTSKTGHNDQKYKPPVLQVS